MKYSLDCTARRVLCTSLMYYGLETSLLSDHEFDAHCKRLYEEWDDLTPYRQWQLGPHDDIRASGYHVKINDRTVRGALNWGWEEKKFNNVGVWYTRKPKKTKHDLENGDGVKRIYEWWNTSDFVWNPEERKSPV